MRRLAAIALVAAAACGDLGTPDLATGEVRGKIAGGTAAGYVYPLGRPDLFAPLAADGSFRLTAPVGPAELVLYDGNRVPVEAPFGRAGRVVVDVEAAEVADVGTRDGLPVAGAILAGVRAESGAACRSPRFLAELLRDGVPVATNQDATIASGLPTALLAPLPPARYQLRVSMDGFQTRLVDIELSEAETESWELDLLVDDDDDVRGCVATGGCASGELECGDDGRCAPAEDPEPAPGACGVACDGSGPSPCQAGLACVDSTCSPAGGASCATYLATAGAVCASDGACDALASGACSDGDEEHLGFCTAACHDDAACAAFPAGWTCSGDRCRPPHD